MFTRSLLSSLVALGVLLPGPALAQRDRDDDDVRSRLDTTIAFGRTGIVDLSLVSGDIVVTGWTRDQARIVASSERGRIRSDLGSSRLTLEVESDRGRMGNTKIEVTVPAGVRVITRTMSGDISVKGVKGAVEARTTSGDIEVDDATDRVIIESVSGDVRGSRLTGEVRGESVSGTLELDGVTGDVRIETTSGDLSLVRVTSRNVYATTVSGEVQYSGSIDANGRYEFHSHSGNIRLDVPEGAGVRFGVETYSGSIESAFPITLQPGQGIGRRPRRMEFTLGNGSARVTAETFSGDITIERATRSDR